MNRRRALQSVAVVTLSLGGCLDRRGIVGESETTVRQDAGWRVSVGEVSPDELAAVGVTPKVEVARSAVTDDHPATIRLSLTSNEFRTLRRTVCPPADVHVVTRADRDAMLALLLADEQSFEPASPNCWRPRLQDFQVGEPCGPAEVTIPAGGTTTRTYEVWDHPKNEACMPPGTYEFGETYRLDGREYEWGFTLAVE